MARDGWGENGVTAHALAEKFRRALRNGTGATFTNAELLHLGRIGALLMIAEAETQELCGAPTAQAWERTGDERKSTDLVKDEVPDEASRPATVQAYSPQTLASRWSCSAQKVRSMCRSGELKSFTYGKLIRISAAEVARFESQGMTRPND